MDFFHGGAVSVDIWHWMGLTRRPPKKDAFRDLLIKLDPAELDRVVRQWVALDPGLSGETETLRGLRIDGQSLCATLRPYARALPLLAALVHHVRWPGVKQVCRIVRGRTRYGKREVETACYASSPPRARADATPRMALIRDHWGAIENGVHHGRDTTFDEDRCTICRGHAAENLAAFRNTALNRLRQAGTVNPAATIRSFTRQSQRLFTKLGFVK